jgi:hypothetical protein
LVLSLHPQENINKSIYASNRKNEIDRSIEYFNNLTNYEFSINQNLNLTKKHLEHLKVYAYNDDSIKSFIQYILDNYNSVPIDLTKSILEYSYSLNDIDFSTQITDIFKNSKNQDLIVLSFFYLHRGGGKINEDYKIQFISKVKNAKIYLKQLKKQKQKIPPIQDLLSFYKKKTEWVLFSFQYKNRHRIGFLIIKDPKGNFKKTGETLLIFKQLSLSITNLPSFIKMGNTPQGIYKNQKKLISSNPYIGKTPSLKLGLPFEIPIQQFNPDSNSRDYLSSYQSLLPNSWQNYTPIYDAYYAGYLGRSGIWMHGSTLEPNLFNEINVDRITPTYGCLSMFESYDEEGNLVSSDQLNFIYGLGDMNLGYSIILEVNNDFDQKMLESMIEELEID